MILVILCASLPRICGTHRGSVQVSINAGPTGPQRATSASKFDSSEHGSGERASRESGNEKCDTNITFNIGGNHRGPHSAHSKRVDALYYHGKSGSSAIWKELIA